MGTDTLIAQFPPKGASNVPMPTQLDLDAVRQAVPGIAHIGALSLFSGPIVFHGRTTNASFVGSTAGIQDAMRLALREGRFLSPFDANETYGVIGDQLAQASARRATRCNWATVCVSTTTCFWWWAFCTTNPGPC